MDKSALTTMVQEVVLGIFYHIGTYPEPRANFISLWWQKPGYCMGDRLNYRVG